MDSKERVLALYPGATMNIWPIRPALFVVMLKHSATESLGSGDSEAEAWDNAASRLPTAPTEPAPSASAELREQAIKDVELAAKGLMYLVRESLAGNGMTNLEDFITSYAVEQRTRVLQLEVQVAKLCAAHITLHDKLQCCAVCNQWPCHPDCPVGIERKRQASGNLGGYDDWNKQASAATRVIVDAAIADKEK